MEFDIASLFYAILSMKVGLYLRIIPDMRYLEKVLNGILSPI